MVNGSVGNGFRLELIAVAYLQQSLAFY